jgi:hypothetical protein
MPRDKVALKFPMRDKRCVFKARPGVDLEDYSGPFKPDLRLTDFSRKQLARMYELCNVYNYEVLRDHTLHVLEHYGHEDMVDSIKFLGTRVLPKEVWKLNKKYMNIKGDSLEDFMKAWQTDVCFMTPKFDATFEMPDKYRGVVVISRCPIVEDYEASGQTDKIPDICAVCTAGIECSARIYDFDIDVVTLAKPPRKSKDHICCAFQLQIRGDMWDEGKPLETAKVELKIAKNKKDRRMDLEIDPNVELEDYSGPFRSDLKIVDFSKPQLARMYCLTTEYDLVGMLGWQQWVFQNRGGYDPMCEIVFDVWGARLPAKIVALNEKYFKIPRDKQAFVKNWQVDMTGQAGSPGPYNMSFEKKDEDHYIAHVDRCVAIDMGEALLPRELTHELCIACAPDTIQNAARKWNPGLDVKILKIPPRTADGETCCSWEIFYDKEKDPAAR